MAGATLRKIYCWEMRIEDLTVYLASTRKGAAGIGLTLERRSDCIDFFKGIFPNNTLLKDYRVNLPLVRKVKALSCNDAANRPVDLDIECTPFQWLVFKAIAEIPFGETRSYGEVASMIGRPNNARAVGQALGKNPLPLIFP